MTSKRTHKKKPQQNEVRIKIQNLDDKFSKDFEILGQMKMKILEMKESTNQKNLKRKHHQ
jgi:hypothetical protein